MSTIKLTDIGLPEHSSFSQLTSLMDCEVKYVIGKSGLIPETPAWWFIGGTAMHAAIEEWEHLRAQYGDLHGAETLKGLFAQQFDAEVRAKLEDEPNTALWRAGKKGSEGEAWWRRAAPEWCEQYVNQARILPPLHDTEGKPAVEVKFSMTFAGITVKGAIDQVLEGPGSERRLRDLKFGASDGNPLQLGLYRVALKEHYDLDIHLADFWNPRKRVQAPPINVRAYNKQFFDDLFGRFEERRGQPPLPNVRGDWHCSSCDFRRVCPAWPDTEGPFEL